MLDDLALFVAVVEAGSLSAAAQKMSLPAATLTRRLQKLEQQLGCRLLSRSARRMQVTSEGRQYYEQCRPLLQALQQATQALDITQHSVAGLIRVLAPITLANGLFKECWASFMQKFPEVQLELKLSNLQEDLLGSGADLAIRAGVQQDSSFNQRRLGEVHWVMVAASGYLKQYGQPQIPEELSNHHLIVAEPMARWHLHHKQSGEAFVLQAQAKFRVNELSLAVHMAKEGIGISYCPVSLCCDELISGELQEVLPDWQADSRTIYAVWPQQRYLPARVRALLEHLLVFAAAEPLLNGSSAA
ncbi:LysR family transcriptional regulator [Iodobacter sp. CM08]|uniref:LysR family transcriptional regulator n=1 Tax=Iodobacter sp. CM08 TaxID=3085902 RepID=UPI0029824CEA|nr:LysR family transcriptional regulator [Iodobacter sp. CM08]MDW5416578.1 LysR family transcriptional regulator [Iodobacter sp. CM08]